jgi:hypothetical protein
MFPEVEEWFQKRGGNYQHKIPPKKKRGRPRKYPVGYTPCRKIKHLWDASSWLDFTKSRTVKQK